MTEYDVTTVENCMEDYMRCDMEQDKTSLTEKRGDIDYDPDVCVGARNNCFLDIKEEPIF